MINLAIRKLLTIVLFLTALLLSYTLLTYAWTTDTYVYSQNIIGKSRKTYFAGGDGSSNYPYVISEPEHLFNLSILQNLDYFNDSQYFFQVGEITARDASGNPTTVIPTTIDFSNTIALYQTIAPIGTETNPFIGDFDGNTSVLKSLTVDGDGRQDIGLFGYLGDRNSSNNISNADAYIYNLFIEQPRIISFADDLTGFTPRYNDEITVTTGYIAGFKSEFSDLRNVFIVDDTSVSENPVFRSTLDSSSNNNLNRSQYGLIGFNEFDNGEVPGSPNNAYNFDLDAASAKSALTYAYNNYASSLINGSSTLTLSDALSSTGYLTSGYSLSTLRIDDPEPSADPVAFSDGTVFLYDQLVAKGQIIGAGGSEYTRENIDVVGEIAFGSTTYQIFQNIGIGGFTSPNLNTTFDANDFPNAIFLYVKPTNDVNDLGDVTGVYSGGGQLSYLSSFDVNGNYVEGRYWANKNDPNLANFGSSGVTQTMTAANAFAKVSEVGTDAITGDPIYEVVDVAVPDYYVFIVAVTNGQITISDITFSYQPAGATPENFSSLGVIDYINTDQVSTIANAISVDPANYEYNSISYLYMEYDINTNQFIDVQVERLSNGEYNIYIDYDITDTSLFYFYIYNIGEGSIGNTIHLYISYSDPSSYSLIGTYDDATNLISIEFLNPSTNGPPPYNIFTE